MRWSRYPRIALYSILLVLGFAIYVAAQSQDTARRLILKDGSYQLVTKYEVKGDRVRYYSSEREEWEELPNSLVDWPATEKFEKERAAAAAAPEAVQLDKEAVAEREAEETPLPEVAPGLRLPMDSGVFLLDSFQGEPQIVEIQQIAGDVNRNTSGNILRGAFNPIAGIKQSIEIPGAHAHVQSHVAVPSLYISADQAPDTSLTPNPGSPNTRQGPEQPQQPQQASVPFDRFLIVHAEVKGSKRIVGEVKRAVTGKITEQQRSVKTTIDRVAGGWFKVTPTEPLAPGEYALVEVTGNEGINLDLWDFGVNPRAPANANPWKPEVKNSSPPAPPNK